MFKRLLILTAVCAIFLQWGATAYAAGEDKLERVLPSPRPGQETILPTKNLKTQVIPRVINLALGLTATAGMGIFVYAGVMLIIAQGNEEDVTKFKNILLWSLVGLAFISAAYALVQGIMKLVLK